MFRVVNFSEEVLGTFSTVNAAVEAASAQSSAQWVEDQSGNILFIKRRTRRGKAQRAPQENCNYNGVSWNPTDLIACKQACWVLIIRGLELNVLRTLNFGNLDVDIVYEEYLPEHISPAPVNVNQLKAEINRLKAEVACREAGMKDQNSLLLIEEVRNLRQKVGEGFVSGDYYAPERYYSKIEGVKNIRRAAFDGEPHILVKVTSPKGELLPKEITVEGTTYQIVYIESRKYKGKIDY